MKAFLFHFIGGWIFFFHWGMGISLEGGCSSFIGGWLPFFHWGMGISLEGGYYSFIAGWIFHWGVDALLSLGNGYFIWGVDALLSLEDGYFIRGWMPFFRISLGGGCSSFIGGWVFH